MLTRRSFLAASSISTVFLAMPAFAGGRTGTFVGVNGHKTTGAVEVHDGKINLLADFVFDGAPDPKVAFGKNGYDSKTLMGKLVKNTGAQSYEIPANLNADDYNEVWIWCERFNVPLGVAKLD